MKKVKLGFTLVEMLIVLAVIGILASIAVVSYSGISKRSQDASLRSDLSGAGNAVNLWLSEHTVQDLRNIYNDKCATWIVGKNSENKLSANAKYWNDMPNLPRIVVSPNSTIEIISCYPTSLAPFSDGANERMLKDNSVCITGAVKGGVYNYIPMSLQPAKYDKMLYYDGIMNGIFTLQEIGEAYDRGKPTACTAHLLRWRQATGQ